MWIANSSETRCVTFGCRACWSGFSPHHKHWSQTKVDLCYTLHHHCFLRIPTVVLKGGRICGQVSITKCCWNRGVAVTCWKVCGMTTICAFCNSFLMTSKWNKIQFPSVTHSAMHSAESWACVQWILFSSLSCTY